MKRLKAKGREVRDAAWEADDNNHHLYVWSSQQLANLFRVAGYEVVEAQTKKYSRTATSDGAWRSGGGGAGEPAPADKGRRAAAGDVRVYPFQKKRKLEQCSQHAISLV